MQGEGGTSFVFLTDQRLWLAARGRNWFLNGIHYQRERLSQAPPAGRGTGTAPEKEAGDEGARNILIERNLRLVAHVVKKFDNTGEDTEDLISIGVIGLIKAINTFDPGKNTRLATYAARCIENENSLSMGNADLPIRLHPVGLAVDHQVAAGAALLADHHLGGGDLYLQAVAPEEQAEGIALPATG